MAAGAVSKGSIVSTVSGQVWEVVVMGVILKVGSPARNAFSALLSRFQKCFGLPVDPTVARTT